MAQAIRGNRRSTAMEALLSRAFDVGSQPEQNRNNAIVVTAPNRKKFSLITKDGQVTAAGKYWYENLNNVPAPTLYRYEQPLINETHVKRFDGSDIKVRNWNKTEGNWAITAARRNYFKYNRSEFIVDIPYVRAAQIDADVHRIKRPSYRRDLDTWYKPLIDYDIGDPGMPMPVTTGSVRQATRGSMRPRNLQASPEQQKQEVIESAKKILEKRPRVMGDDGIVYVKILEESESVVLWDQTRELIVHEQRVNFWDDQPPSTETILGRPLRNFAIPDGMYRSWELHPDTFKSFNHGCVVQMLLKSLTKQASGPARIMGNKDRVPMFTQEQIQAGLDAIFTRIGYKVGDAPFEEGGWREVGATAQMIIEYCKDLEVNCYVHHGRNLLTYIAPVNKDGMAIVNVSIWGDHVYFYGSDTVGRCQMNYVVSRKANSNPQLEYGKMQKDKPMRDHYSSCQIESPFPWLKLPPFDEWRDQGDL